MSYKELEPVEEVYRIRTALLEEYGGIQGYQKHINETSKKMGSYGFSQSR